MERTQRAKGKASKQTLTQTWHKMKTKNVQIPSNWIRCLTVGHSCSCSLEIEMWNNKLPIRVSQIFQAAACSRHLQQIKLMWWVEFDVSKLALKDCKRLNETRCEVYSVGVVVVAVFLFAENTHEDNPNVHWVNCHDVPSQMNLFVYSYFCFLCFSLALPLSAV